MALAMERGARAFAEDGDAFARLERLPAASVHHGIVPMHVLVQLAFDQCKLPVGQRLQCFLFLDGQRHGRKSLPR
ncbi:hypothetical protein GN244_ATG17644 [Phytophthora infestans]|uniref:Uncharacterized protein n=1 Tax=Phytophthora infestans TaxID=4787 RepID=A0A833S8R3_PHYIN|nr:hypothetical protein GN244_ATG17644 [Phytophthora infestans]KAF4128289.1 hypothetical protein GN958_ATG22519 [Phytophthora infestans]